MRPSVRLGALLVHWKRPEGRSLRLELRGSPLKAAMWIARAQRPPAQTRPCRWRARRGPAAKATFMRTSNEAGKSGSLARRASRACKPAALVSSVLQYGGGGAT